MINVWDFKEKAPFVFEHLTVHSVSLFGEILPELLHLALQSVIKAKNEKKMHE